MRRLMAWTLGACLLLPWPAAAQVVQHFDKVQVTWTDTTPVPGMDIQQTWNAPGTTFPGALTLHIFDVQSAVGSTAFEIFGGVNATTSLVRVTKLGAVTFGSSISQTAGKITSAGLVATGVNSPLWWGPNAEQGDITTNADGDHTCRFNSGARCIWRVGTLEAQAGSGDVGKAPVTLSSQVSVSGVGSVGAGETTLFTYSMPVNTMLVAGDRVKLRASGTTASNGTSKAIRLYFGATGCITLSNGLNTGVWRAECEVTAASSTTQAGYGYMFMSSTNGTTWTNEVQSSTSPVETLTSGSVVLKVTGQGGADNDIRAMQFTVEFWGK